MDPTNPPAPPQRIIRNAAHFHQLEAEARAAALNGANAGNCADFPEDDDDAQVALVDQLLEAMANTAGVIDNVNEDLDDNSDVKAIRDLPRGKQESMAWRALFKVRDVQRGIYNPDILTARFPNFMSRWKAFVALVRSSKAGCTDLFAASYMDRYTANPVMELDTKLSNNNTNKNKDYNNEIKAARHHGRIVTKLDDRAEIRDASGELIETLMKPRKRVLSDFLDPELAQSPVAKVKRARGSRRGTGASASPVATFATPANGGSPAESTGTNPLPPIQEEEEPSEHHQANPVSAPVDDHHSNDEHLNAEHLNAIQSNAVQSNEVQSNEVQSNAVQSNADYPRAEHLNADQSIADQSNADLDNAEHIHAGHGGASMNTAGMDNAYMDNASINTAGMDNAGMDNAYMDNAYMNTAGMDNAGMDNAYMDNASMNTAGMDNAYMDNAYMNTAGMDNAYMDNAYMDNTGFNNTGLNNAGVSNDVLDNAHQYDMPHQAPVYQTPNQHATLDQIGANARWAASQQAPAHPASVLLGAVDQSLEQYHSNTNNGGNQAGSGGAAVNQTGHVIQNRAGSNWWVEDGSSDELD